MSLSFNIKNKLKIAALLIVVFGLIFLNNINEDHDSAELKKAISSIYNDRLLAESYILKLSENMHRIIDFSDQPDGKPGPQEIRKTLSDIDSVKKAYLKTKLTILEKKKFDDFNTLQSNVRKALRQEDFGKAGELSYHSLSVLNDLSLIQVSEAKIVMVHTEKLFGSGVISSKFEIGILIVIALLIQVMIFTSETAAPKNFKNN
ncbi:MAG: hypothetical protein ACO1O6_11470 [Bacteroidota bacterium]